MINSFAALSPEGEGFFIFLAVPLRHFEFWRRIYFQILRYAQNDKEEIVFSDSLLRLR